MKKLLILPILLTFFPTPAISQQMNVIRECRNYIENYYPGRVDYYGNYIQGGVATQRNNVNCDTGQVYSSVPYYNNYPPQYQYNRPYYNNQYYSNNPINPNCNLTRTLLGATLGGAIGRSMTSTYNNRNNRGWATALGAAIGGLTFSC